MKPFLDKDFLLSSDTARTLYHDHAAKMPIIDYHCHIKPSEIAADRRYDSITDVWLGGDHYKWRAMRSCGVPERCITGDADPEEKFVAWARTVQTLIGNPLYHWTHLELQRYFDISEPLTAKNAKAVYRACNEVLARPDMSVRGIIDRSNVRLICTTDDPIDDLAAHEQIAADPTCRVAVLPAFRPDKAMRADKPEFAAYLKKLETVTGMEIDNMDDLRAALVDRIAYFDAHGCRVSDHGLDTAICETATEAELNDILEKGKSGRPVSAIESEAFQTALLATCAKEYRARGWVMQWHFGCIRNNSTRMFERLGPDTGFDAMNDAGGNAVRLARMLDLLEQQDALPRTILYSLNPADNGIIGTVMGGFQTDSDVPGRIQLGSAWWFNDHKSGMEQQLRDLMNLGAIGSFVGMLTDSRSFLSYTRHEYFRRILCNVFGQIVENGEYPADLDALGEIVENISYNNTLHYFRFDEILK
ncbi:MAG: glucuronate isomerase [bacterium]|nr:glucuronate isomerase [bacterium]